MLVSLRHVVLCSTTFFITCAIAQDVKRIIYNDEDGVLSCGYCYQDGIPFTTDNPDDPRTYGLYLPPGYDTRTTDEPWPLIFDFHGAGGSSEGQFDNSQYYLNSQGQQYIVVYPQGINSDWYGPWYADSDSFYDVDFVSALLKFTTSQHNIDTNQIFASGKSAGAGFVGYLACQSETANSFKAYAIASAALYLDSSPSCSSAPALTCGPRNILEVHGLADTTINYYYDRQTYPNLYCNVDRCHPERSRNCHPASLPQISDWVLNWGKRNFVDMKNTKAIPNDGTNLHWNYTGKAVIDHYRIANLAHCWPQNTTQRANAPNTDSAKKSCQVNPGMDFTSKVVAFFAAAKPPISTHVDANTEL